MKHIILFLSLLIWTQAQAYESERFRTVELTYDDLAHELAMKKRKAAPAPQTGLLGLGRTEWSMGLALSSAQYQLPRGSKSFSQSGLDFRWNQAFQQSAWSFEGSVKSYASATAGNSSAESKVLGAAAKIQKPLPENMSYVLGVGSSLNFIRVRDSFKRRESTDLALIGLAGVKGPINQRLSWGFEMQASSPMGGKIMNGGLETSLLISSSM